MRGKEPLPSAFDQYVRKELPFAVKYYHAHAKTVSEALILIIHKPKTFSINSKRTKNITLQMIRVRMKQICFTTN